MKKMKLFWMFLLLGAAAVTFTACPKPKVCTYEEDRECFCDANPDDPRCSETACTYEEDPACFCEQNPDDINCVSVEASLPDSIKNGSNFYVLSMDGVSERLLGDKVIAPTILRDIQVWEEGTTLAGANRMGLNAWGQPEAWISFDVAGSVGWNGGGIMAVYSEYEVVPDLTPVDDGGYYLHFAIKSPTNQPNAGWTIFVYNDGTEQKYYYGLKANCPEKTVYGGNYPHDGEWHHFEISVDEMVANSYSWSGALDQNPAYQTPDDPETEYKENSRLVLGFQGHPHVVGTELNLDAIFYYKKP